MERRSCSPLATWVIQISEGGSLETLPKLSGDVKDITLAERGKRRIEWANQHMPVLQLIRKQFIKEQPL